MKEKASGSRGLIEEKEGMVQVRQEATGEEKMYRELKEKSLKNLSFTLCTSIATVELQRFGFL